MTQIDIYKTMAAIVGEKGARLIYFAMDGKRVKFPPIWRMVPRILRRAVRRLHHDGVDVAEIVRRLEIEPIEAQAVIERDKQYRRKRWRASRGAQ